MAFDTYRYNKEPDRPTWEKAHKLYVQAFQTPATPADQKKLAKILRKPLPEHTSKELFEYEGFLRGLGKMNLSTPRLPSYRFLAISTDFDAHARSRSSWWPLHPALPSEPLVLALPLRSPSRSPFCARPHHRNRKTRNRARRRADRNLREPRA